MLGRFSLNPRKHSSPRQATFQREEDIRYTDDRGHARIVLRRGGNIIRWRHGEGPGGERVAESNARLIKWSDGTESVMLGDQVCRQHSVI